MDLVVLVVGAVVSGIAVPVVMAPGTAVVPVEPAIMAPPAPLIMLAAVPVVPTAIGVVVGTPVTVVIAPAVAVIAVVETALRIPPAVGGIVPVLAGVVLEIPVVARHSCRCLQPGVRRRRCCGENGAAEA